MDDFSNIFRNMARHDFYPDQEVVKGFSNDRKNNLAGLRLWVMRKFLIDYLKNSIQ